jgi:hypothetical protein
MQLMQKDSSSRYFSENNQTFIDESRLGIFFSKFRQGITTEKYFFNET